MKNIIKLFSILLISVLLTNCQTTSGQLISKERLLAGSKCKEIEPLNSIFSWEVLGEAKSVESCPVAGILENYKLKNGSFSFQQSGPTQNFKDFDEGVFREALSHIKFFKSNFQTIKTYETQAPGFVGLYALYQSGPHWCSYFRMIGKPDGLGGNRESVYGGVCGSSGVSESNFKKDFDKRMKVLAGRSSKGQRQDFGFAPLYTSGNSEDKSKPATSSEKPSTYGVPKKSKITTGEKKMALERRTRLKNAILVEQTAYQIWGDQSVNNLERLGLDSSDPKTALEKLSLTAQECIDRGFKADTDKFGKCVLKIMEQASKSKPTVGTQTDTLSLKKAKEECAGLGFKKGTEKYGECVLQLHK
jgi:hypothetical protein